MDEHCNWKRLFWWNAELCTYNIGKKNVLRTFKAKVKFCPCLSIFPFWYNVEGMETKLYEFQLLPRSRMTLAGIQLSLPL
jgi:hypothetical protein